MLRRLALVLLPLALLATACTAGGDDIADDATGPEATETPAAVSDPATDGATQEEAAEPPAAISDSSTDEGERAAADILSGALNPFQLLSSLGGESLSQEVDPALKAALLDADDLPDFLPLGEFNISTPTEYGAVEMAASMFVSGDLVSGEFGAMVMSGAMAIPQEALDELGDLNELKNLTEADLDALQAEAGLLGADFRLLDASGLGEDGFGMHMEMDFSGLLGGFGATEEDDVPFQGIAMDIYVFLRGEHVLILMMMWPTDQPPPADARDLAERMDAKAGAF